MILKRDAPIKRLNKLPAMAKNSFLVRDSECLIGTRVSSLKFTITRANDALKKA